jgi:protein-tyrosine phosphatase
VKEPQNRPRALRKKRPALRDVTGMIDYNRILPQLLVGTYLESAQEVQTLHRQDGVTAVLNLQTDQDIRAFSAEPPGDLYAGSGVKLCRVPVRDFDSPDLRQKLPECVRALVRLLDEGHTVYLHCTVGANRSPTVAIAYLHWSLGWDLDSAVKHVKECRCCAPNVDAIRQADWPPDSTPHGTSPLPGKKAP